MTTAVEGGEGSTSRPGRSLPRENPVPIIQEDRWGPGLVWTGAENLAPTGIQSSDRPVSSYTDYATRPTGSIIGGVLNPLPANVENMVSPE